MSLRCWPLLTLVFGLPLLVAPPLRAEPERERERPLVFAHRGASEQSPENTLASFSLAIESGADGIEVDVRTTRDGHLIVMHDATVDRTTDGSGAVADLSLEAIRRLDAGGHVHPRFAGQRVPTLREVLELVGDRADVLLDLKEQGEAYARAVADQVRRYGNPDRTIAGVRGVDQAAQFRRLLPMTRQLGFIRNPTDIEPFVAAGVETIRLWPRWIDSEPRLADRVRRAGARLHLNGTTGELAETKRLLAHRPSSLLVDHPARLIRSLNTLADDHDW